MLITFTSRLQVLVLILSAAFTVADINHWRSNGWYARCLACCRCLLSAIINLKAWGAYQHETWNLKWFCLITGDRCSWKELEFLLQNIHHSGFYFASLKIYNSFLIEDNIYIWSPSRLFGILVYFTHPAVAEHIYYNWFGDVSFFLSYLTSSSPVPPLFLCFLAKWNVCSLAKCSTFI